MTSKIRIALCLMATLIVAGCEQPTPEEIEQAKRDRESVNHLASRTYMGLLPQLGQACAQRIEGKNASFDFLVKQGFKKDRGFGRDFYQAVWQVGEQAVGVTVAMHPDGCLFNLPTTGAIDPEKHRATLIAALKKRGYSVTNAKPTSSTSVAAQSIVTSALFGVSIVSGEVQTATKGATKIELKTTRSSNQYGTGWIENFLVPRDDSKT